MAIESIYLGTLPKHLHLRSLLVLPSLNISITKEIPLPVVEPACAPSMARSRTSLESGWPGRGTQIPLF
uniref:Uncharacterized protein n=1 Tax=Picea sitchensis TaxID=3332 RepID=A0A6B9XRR0_PICSI|nr:hypothetical protein Q903MT_gene6665 [Picea sitchensis]